MGYHSLGIRGVVNDALAIYFLDATMATAFVVPLVCDTEARDRGWEYRVRNDEPTPRIGAGLHKTP